MPCSLVEETKRLYDEFGQRKPMGESAPSPNKPHYFLCRTFLGENDLLIILNTKRCRYQCYFCQLPQKSSRNWISRENILEQFRYVLEESKHYLSILDRLTISNEGSVLDTTTLPSEALLTIAHCVNQLRRVRALVLETRLEFVDPKAIERIKMAAPRVVVDILTGFETLDMHIRDRILSKREPLEVWLSGLDKVAEVGSSLTAYVLYKPSPVMNDEEAYAEAEESIDYLVDQCQRREVPLTIRLNPMYLAKGSKWAEAARSSPDYRPPRLTDIMRLAEKKAQEGVRVYIGLSSEGLSELDGTYMSREDYSPRLIRPIKRFNDGKITCFDWDDLAF